MFFILDVIAVLIFFLTVVSCRTKGFFKSFFGTLKVVLSVIIAYIFMPSVAYFFRTSFVERTITDTVASRLNILAQKSMNGFDLSKLFSDMPTEFSDILNRYGASREALAERFGGFSSANESSVNELAHSITGDVVHTVSDILAFIALFIVSMIVLSIVVWILGLITKLPVISGVDKALGFVFGIISGIILVWVYCNLVTIGVDAISAVKPGLLGSNVVESTYIVKYVSDNFMFGFAAPKA